MFEDLPMSELLLVMAGVAVIIFLTWFTWPRSPKLPHDAQVDAHIVALLRHVEDREKWALEDFERRMRCQHTQHLQERRRCARPTYPAGRQSALIYNFSRRAVLLNTK